MTGYISRRLMQAAVILAVASVVFFVGINASGDPAALMAPLDASTADVEALRIRMGLNRPLPERYVRFVKDLAQGRLYSFRHQRPPSELILPHLGRSLELGLISMIASPMLAIPLGVFAAVKRKGLLHALVSILSLLGQTVPVFLICTILMWIFAVRLRWLPVSGRSSLQSYILPVASMAVFYLAILVRMTRASVLEVLNQDYVRTAHGKGQRKFGVIVQHVLPNALLPIVSLGGLQLAELLSGALVIETIFSWPGLGYLMYDAVLQRDIPVVVVGSLSVVGMVSILNLSIDLLYARLDPRIRYN